ncbi:MAG: DUF1295 domain-containing protein [Gammaproteobacteria bacterium]
MPASNDPIGLTTLCGAMGGVVVFTGLLFIGSRVLPGRRAPGPSLHDQGPPSGAPPVYLLNGLSLFLLTALIVVLGQWLGGYSLATVNRHFLALLCAANVWAVALTGAVFLMARATPHSNGRLGELFFGRALNPSICGVDLKLFSYRPSLIGLGLLNASFAVVQYQTYGSLSTAMVLYQIFTLAYIFNYFQFEHGMLHTWDMVAERFGGMLIWGDYVLVPFFYSLPGWFLVHRLEPLPPWAAVGLTGLFLFGFWLFRGANGQKHRFKLDPATRIWGRPAETIGGRLLVSGLWGLGRHLNYSGEIAIYLAFTLTTGFDSAVPYLLPAWLCGLLIHRAWRDERRCRAKYGDLWIQYTRRVPFRLLPLVY